MKYNLLQKKIQYSRSSDRGGDDVDDPGDAPIDYALPPASTQAHQKRRQRRL